MNLSVNLNKISLLRNARGGGQPDIAWFAQKALEKDIIGLTVHPRPDGRHIVYKDIKIIKDLTSAANKELNIEGNPVEPSNQDYKGYINLINEFKPTQATLVPDDTNQITSDHGWMANQKDELTTYTKEIANSVEFLSIFVDSDIENLSDILNPDISAIEIFTGPYAIAMASDDNKRIDQELKKIATLATFAQKLGLKVNAGHDLTTDNLKNLVELNLIDEVSIGHAIITQSLEYGYEQTLDKYLEIING